ncbi:plasma kallikrein-like [Oppia nitens]|uniref:plasma kallikrein-like n=1 Tax=Oppia nitens TaxID=1686743 RepID=UPI0023DA3E69|nr:plasma kallikrein-like [Oppia nitens]
MYFDDSADNDYRLPSDCGRNSVKRIVGGNESKPHTWPWTVAVYVRNVRAKADDDVSFICGASIIHQRYVLCAAHCVKSFGVITPADQYKLLLGAHDRTNSGQWYNVSKIIVHRKYNETTMQYDIALFKLKEPINFIASNHTMAPLCLADDSMNTETFKNDLSVCVGWGATLPMGDISNKLMQVSIPIASKRECIKAYDKESITDMNVCAGYKEGKKDSCQGDSGGPLMIRRKNHWLQIGIVSWGRGCADKDAYGVYTRVSSHRKWVQNMIAKEK